MYFWSEVHLNVLESFNLFVLCICSIILAMVSQHDAMNEMEEGFAMISVEDEEQGGLTYDENEEGLSEIDTKWCLVVRFPTESSIDFQAIQHKMASLWHLKSL